MLQSLLEQMQYSAIARGARPLAWPAREVHDAKGGLMAAKSSDVRVLQAPLAELERALIDTFIHARGFDRARLAALTEREREALLTEASTYASSRLAEIEARSHYLDELHHQ
jgi:hypothetical protein